MIIGLIISLVCAFIVYSIYDEYGYKGVFICTLLGYLINYAKEIYSLFTLGLTTMGIIYIVTIIIAALFVSLMVSFAKRFSSSFIGFILVYEVSSALVLYGFTYVVSWLIKLIA